MGSQYRILSGQPLVRFCGQQPAATFLNNPPPEKKRMRRWSTFLSQFKLKISTSQESRMNYVTICLRTTLTHSIKWNWQGSHFKRWSHKRT